MDIPRASGDRTMADIVEHRSMKCFEQRNPLGSDQDDVPALLRRVADTIEELGDVEVADLVLHQRITRPDGRDWPSIVVYYRAVITPSGRTSAPAPP